MACRGACDLFRWVSASAMGYCAASRSDCGANPVLTSPKRATFRDQAILAHVASGMRAYRHKGCMHQRRRGGAADLEVTVTRGDLDSGETRKPYVGAGRKRSGPTSIHSSGQSIRTGLRTLTPCETHATWPACY